MHNWLIVHTLDGSVPPDVCARMAPAGERVVPGLHVMQRSLTGDPLPVTTHGPYTFVGDVRLDNRDDVRRALRLAPDSTDETLILQAYERWGDECLERFIGVWAFAIWDSTRQTLWLARDPIGVRQLYYARHKRVVAAAPTIEALWPLWEAGPSPNEAWLREFARRRLLTRAFEETAWEGIRCLPPGHEWALQEQPTQPRRYWLFGTLPAPRYRTDEDYAEHLRDLFDEAVRCRLDRKAPTAISVSGGLDSTSITGTADGLVKRGFPAQLRLYSLTFASDRHADERHYLADVVRRFPYPLTTVPGDETLTFRALGMSSGERPRPQPEPFVFMGCYETLFNRAAADGCHVVLYGEGGNQVMGEGLYFDGRFLRDWPLWNWPAELRAAARYARDPLWRVLRAALVPDIVRRLFRRQVWDLPIRPGARVTWAGRTVVRIETNGKSGLTMTSQIEMAARAGLEMRFPFLDIRLVEFMISLPARLHAWRGRPRWLMTQAFADCMPASVRERLDGATPSFIIARLARGPEAAIVRDLLQTPGLARFVEMDTINRAWKALPDEEGLPLVYRWHEALEPAAAIGAWLRWQQPGRARTELNAMRY